MLFIVDSDVFPIHARWCLISWLHIEAKVTCQSLYKDCALSCFCYFDDMYALTNPCWTVSFLLIRHKSAQIINLPSWKVTAPKRPMFSALLRCSLWMHFLAERVLKCSFLCLFLVYYIRFHCNFGALSSPLSSVCSFTSETLPCLK